MCLTLKMQASKECACVHPCGASEAQPADASRVAIGLNGVEARDACVLHKPASMVGNLEVRSTRGLITPRQREVKSSEFYWNSGRAPRLRIVY